MRKKLISVVLACLLLLALATTALATVVILGERQGRRDYAGLSTDTKPTSAVMYGSTFYVTDTRVLYVYTGEGWVTDRRPAPPRS